MRGMLLPLVALGTAVALVSCAALARMPAPVESERAMKVEAEGNVVLNILWLLPKRELIAYPVLLVPDAFLSADEFFTGPQGGLARYLAERGFEVFAVDLRGMGSSSNPGSLESGLIDWCLDDWLEHDIPGAIEAVCRASGEEKVILIGHGLGGTLAMLAGARYPDRVAAVVGLGSPGGVWRPPNKLIAAILAAGKRLADDAPLEVGECINAPAPFPSDQTLLELLLFNDSGFDSDAATGYFDRATGYLSSCIVHRLIEWYEGGTLSDRGGTADLLEGLDGLVQPTLIVAGKLDHLFCPGEVLMAYDAIPAEDKEFFIASKVNGLSADYGHMGLVMGPRADRDIYRRIARWVRNRFSR